MTDARFYRYAIVESIHLIFFSRPVYMTTTVPPQPQANYLCDEMIPTTTSSTTRFVRRQAPTSSIRWLRESCLRVNEKNVFESKEYQVISFLLLGLRVRVRENEAKLLSLPTCETPIHLMRFLFNVDVCDGSASTSSSSLHHEVVHRHPFNSRRRRRSTVADDGIRPAAVDDGRFDGHVIVVIVLIVVAIVHGRATRDDARRRGRDRQRARRGRRIRCRNFALCKWYVPLFICIYMYIYMCRRYIYIYKF